MEQLSTAFHALADPTRRRILQLLSEGSLTAGSIADQFPISKPSVSHHLHVLKEAGLVADYRQGQHIIYSIKTEAFQTMLIWLSSLAAKS
ncbi:MAG TPA: winged helix-turn-helix transcriptional regulator [Firmicutes bacterium]|nr:winged helix-turn-helix transcriptional regulator [Bacillota bacterium]